MAEQKPRVTVKDFEKLAEFIQSEAKRRRALRATLGITHVWKEIDRQVSMRPDLSYKQDRNGNLDPNNWWMPELELPLQAQTLEVLTADARRLLFPDGGDWFACSALAGDKLLEALESQSLIAGDETDVPSKITQDNVDKLVAGLVANWHRQYDFEGHIDRVNAEAFRYGTGVFRVRRVKKSVVTTQQGNVYKADATIPVLLPRSIKHVFPDDRQHIAMNEGEMMAPLVIECHRKSLLELKRAAAQGSSDPDDYLGGWMPKGLEGLEADKGGMIETIEAEGDFIIERKTRAPLVLHNCCIEIAVGASDTRGVFRLRWMPEPTYVFVPYHLEDAESVYSTSPLMKGWPIQYAAVDTMCRMAIAGAMSANPPVQYDRADTALAADGGPRLHPGASIQSMAPIVPLQIGNPQALAGIYTGYLMQYADVTGVNAPRLGAQTVSHTTAYSKQVEMARGEVRTVDYVKAMLRGPLTAYLGIAWRMGRAAMKGVQTFYVESFGGYVDNITKDMLPEDVTWKAIGAAGPQEEAQKRANKLASVQLAIQIDQAAAQAGVDTGLDLNAVIYSVLRDGGWTDVDAIIKQQPAAPPPGAESAGPAVPGEDAAGAGMAAAAGLPGAVPATAPSLATLGVVG